jgi:hypothetical protein
MHRRTLLVYDSQQRPGRQTRERHTVLRRVLDRDLLRVLRPALRRRLTSTGEQAVDRRRELALGPVHLQPRHVRHVPRRGELLERRHVDERLLVVLRGGKVPGGDAGDRAGAGVLDEEVQAEVRLLVEEVLAKTLEREVERVELLRRGRLGSLGPRVEGDDGDVGEDGLPVQAGDVEYLGHRAHQANAQAKEAMRCRGQISTHVYCPWWQV